MHIRIAWLCLLSGLTFSGAWGAPSEHRVNLQRDCESALSASQMQRLQPLFAESFDAAGDLLLTGDEERQLQQLFGDVPEAFRNMYTSGTKHLRALPPVQPRRGRE